MASWVCEFAASATSLERLSDAVLCFAISSAMASARLSENLRFSMNFFLFASLSSLHFLNGAWTVDVLVTPSRWERIIRLLSFSSFAVRRSQISNTSFSNALCSTVSSLIILSLNWFKVQLWMKAGSNTITERTLFDVRLSVGLVLGLYTLVKLIPRFLFSLLHAFICKVFDN